MDFSELIKTRQSVRSYIGKPVEEEKILQCVEAARLAPSANNSQPWKFVVTDDPAVRDRLAAAAAALGINGFVREAPVVAAVVLERPNLLSAAGSAVQDKEYPLIDIGIAASHFCLQAADLGLGTCIIGWFNEQKVKDILGIDPKRRVPLLITLGYSESPQRRKSRKPFDKIYRRNRY